MMEYEEFAEFMDGGYIKCLDFRSHSARPPANRRGKTVLHPAPAQELYVFPKKLSIFNRPMLPISAARMMREMDESLFPIEMIRVIRWRAPGLPYMPIGRVIFEKKENLVMIKVIERISR